MKRKKNMDKNSEGYMFENKVVVAAIVGCLTCCSHILNMNSQNSYHTEQAAMIQPKGKEKVYD